MSKIELIDRIMQINQSARREFLEGFSATELNDYLQQLESIEVTPIQFEIIPEAA